MDIAALSITLSQMKLQSEVSTAILAKTLDQQETSSDGLQKIMEQSVTPHLGQSVDISL